jgi:hypothetical protein
LSSLLCDLMCVVITEVIRRSPAFQWQRYKTLAEKLLSSTSFTPTMATANSAETSVTNDGCTWHLTEGVNVRKREFPSLGDRGMTCILAQLASNGLIAEWYLLLVIYCENKPTPSVYVQRR